VFSQFLGFFAWNRSLAIGGIARISQMQLLQPFVALAAAALLHGEPIGFLEIGFAVLVVGLVALGWHMRVAHSS
jgi:drug/metabolite transporter (DMT)-like permease